LFVNLGDRHCQPKSPRGTNRATGWRTARARIQKSDEWGAAMRQGLKGLVILAGAVLALSGRVAHAGTITTTITFDDVPLGGPELGVGANFVDGGFRFSPCHNYGIVSSSQGWLGRAPYQGFNDSQYFVFQAGNGPGNPDYLGSMPGCGEPREAVGSS